MKYFLKSLLLLVFSLSLYGDFNGNYPDVSAVPRYTNIASFPSAVSSGNGSLGIALDTNILYESNGTIWQALASPGSPTGIGTFDSGVASANGAHIDTGLLIMQSASATVPGLVNIGAQSLAGVKTFASNPIMSSLTASQAVVTNGSKALASLGYASANTASNLVQRDASGNFTATTVTAALTGTASGNPPNARLINTTAPLTGGGDLSADRTIAITQSTTSTNGYLSSVDWNTFNNKQASGSYITALTGDVSATGPGSVAATVNTVGGASAANIASTVTTVAARASANTVSTIVARDGSGNFTAGTITAALVGNASTVTTNANLTGPITSVGNATSLAAQTGTGSVFVVQNTPTLTTPVIGAATGTSLQLSGLTASQAVVTDGSKNLSSLAYASGNTASSIVQRDASGNFSAGTISVSGLNDSGLTASQAVVTDSTKNLTSLAYASANTASALVQRDASGNFTAGVITAPTINTSTGVAVQGANTNSSASAGYYGEVIPTVQAVRFVQVTPAVGTYYAVTGTAGAAFAVTLTPGDWDLSVTGDAEIELTSAPIGNVSAIVARIYNTSDSVSVLDTLICNVGGATALQPLICAGPIALKTQIKVASGGNKTYQLYIAAVTISGTGATVSQINFNVQGFPGQIIYGRRAR